MNMEIFDVVNERDEVVARRPRSEVHRLGLNHRAAHILVFNARGGIFLQKRSRFKDRHPSVWDSSASGHVDSGEHYDIAAVRELKEELGLVLTKPLKHLFKLNACAETGHEFVWVYQCQSEGPFVLPPSEIERGSWFDPGFVTHWMQRSPAEFAPTFPVIWKKMNGLP